MTVNQFGDEKGKALLNFLKAEATIRRGRKPVYSSEDRVLWLGVLPRELPECRSPFLSEESDDLGRFWVEVRKKRMPTRPPVPQAVEDWVCPEDLDQPWKVPELLPEITVIRERQVADPEASPETPRTITQQVAERCCLADHPEIEEAWLEYLVEKWEPWCQEMRRWETVQSVYEQLDFMWRRLVEAEERYEVVLAIGFLQWRDPTGVLVARHILTAPAELTLDGARGLLTVVPAASFDGFRIELDMLDPQDQPRLDKAKLDQLLEELDVQAWDIRRVAPILHEIANSLSADAQVEETFRRSDRFEERPHLSFAPAVVLRERRSTAYEKLIDKFIEVADKGGLKGTAPWLRLLWEGEPPDRSTDAACGANTPTPAPVDRFLFPLPANDEQRQIVQRLEGDPCVLVKGPPGTGKSHTIANLICHLLASGERVLVTAYAPKALTVLRNMLPRDVQDLCVTALGYSREDQHLLEQSVREILKRRNEGPGSTAAQQEIEKAEADLQGLEGELARVERDLRVFRELETHSHELPGGYSGTAAHIARLLREREHEFGWFPELSGDTEFPLDALDTAFLVDAHAIFTPDVRTTLQLEIGTVDLPEPDVFAALVDRLSSAEELAERARQAVDRAKLDLLEPVVTDQLLRVRNTVETFNHLAVRADRVFGQLAQTVLGDFLAGAWARWSGLAADSTLLVKTAVPLVGTVGEAQVQLPDSISEDQLRLDVERRLAYFEAGGWKGFFVFVPRTVRETKYIKGCRINGRRVEGIEELRRLRDYLTLKHSVSRLQRLWSGVSVQTTTSKQAVVQYKELTDTLAELVLFFESEAAGLLSTVLGSGRMDLASEGGRSEWLKAIDATLVSREARDAEGELDRLLDTVRSLQHRSKGHPCLRALEEAIRARDVVAWKVAWEERERVREERKRLARYENLLEKLGGLCPQVAELLRSTAGDPVWQDRARKLREAWAWAAARAWLRRFSDASTYEERVQDYHRLQQKILKATERLVALRAWKAFYDRLDEKTIQSLNAWAHAVDRIGKGTGKHAYRHRRTAQRYLMECIPSIPAWIMPLHKLWDSVDAVPGLFDTVIVDEASQAGVDALVLLLLAKRIVVVGDDKQNSPEAVGVMEEDIARLAREHLGAFRFRDEFRPDTSLFDHAERAFGSPITLREHFRCVPEIIRFSNELCYTDAPLIPLRQAPPARLPPLRSRFVAEGSCEGEGPRIRNRAEAEALVQTIVSLVDDEAYEGKTMGVIALQGHEQARLIERLLVQRLDPKVIEERRLRCGEPATFQGDERDVMFLSLVIAPNVHFRALTRLPDVRRFNVAMSRARDQVWLFHSVRLHDLAREDLRYRLIRFFETPQSAASDANREDLDRLERAARGPRRPGTQPEPYESWFEVDVAMELLRRGYRVRPQVEVAGYRIDLVVEGLVHRLAVECDGEVWHGLERFEQDMARQRQLERAGWNFVRIRESEFYGERDSAVARVLKACDELRIRPVVEEEQGIDQEPTASTVADSALSEEHERERQSGTFGEGGEEVPEAEEAYPGPVHSAEGVDRLVFPDPRVATTANVQSALYRIIETQGPLTKRLLFRLYVEGCPALHRAGKTVKSLLNRALYNMLRAGEIIVEDELGDRSLESQVVRIVRAPRVKERQAGGRDLLEIPPSELWLVLDRLLSSSGGRVGDDEAIFRALLEHYGFSRLTQARRQHLARVLEAYRRQRQ